MAKEQMLYSLTIVRGILEASIVDLEAIIKTLNTADVQHDIDSAKSGIEQADAAILALNMQQNGATNPNDQIITAGSVISRLQTASTTISNNITQYKQQTGDKSQKTIPNIIKTEIADRKQQLIAKLTSQLAETTTIVNDMDTNYTNLLTINRESLKSNIEPSKACLISLKTDTMDIKNCSDQSNANDSNISIAKAAMANLKLSPTSTYIKRIFANHKWVFPIVAVGFSIITLIIIFFITRRIRNRRRIQ